MVASDKKTREDDTSSGPQGRDFDRPKRTRLTGGIMFCRT